MTKIAKRQSLEKPSGYIRSCSLQTEAITADGDDGFGNVLKVPIGQRGTFAAEIVNCDLDPWTLLGKSAVFEWPDGQCFVAIRATEVTIEDRGFERVFRVDANVLGIARYDASKPRAIASRDAQRLLTNG